ncbi:MAG: HIT domain-containing protein [Candidatus Pacearchaeota archaeon]
MEKDCIFCKIANKEIKTEIIYENKNFLAFPDANPKTKGHTLIISKKHFTNSLDMPTSLGNEIIETIKIIAEKKLKEKDIEGFNILQNNFPIAGQVIMHAHFHFLPRRKNDGIKIIG